MLRGGQKEVGTYKQIPEEGAHRRALLFSCDILVIHLWSLGDGWSYILPFHGWRSHVCLGWIHKASVTEETGLWVRALLHCVCRIHRGLCSLTGLVVPSSVPHISPHPCAQAYLNFAENCLTMLQLRCNQSNVGRWKKTDARNLLPCSPRKCICLWFGFDV